MSEQKYTPRPLSSEDMREMDINLIERALDEGYKVLIGKPETFENYDKKVRKDLLAKVITFIYLNFINTTEYPNSSPNDIMKVIEGQLNNYLEEL